MATARAAAEQRFDLIAIVENQREGPLEAWEVVVYDGPASRFPKSESSHDACISLGDQGIARGESSEVYLGPAEEAPPLPFVVLTMATWADLSWEGDPEARARLLRRREDEAGTIAFWVAALKAAEAKASLADAVAYLTLKRDERRRLASDDGSWIEANLPSWTERSRSTPGAKAVELGAFRRQLERQYQLLMRHVAK